MKIFNMITSIVDTGLIISTNITGGFSITAKKQKKMMQLSCLLKASYSRLSMTRTHTEN